jgi:hypothetical protein
MSGITQNDIALGKRLDTIPVQYSKAQQACVRLPATSSTSTSAATTDTAAASSATT